MRFLVHELNRAGISITELCQACHIQKKWFADAMKKPGKLTRAENDRIDDYIDKVESERK